MPAPRLHALTWLTWAIAAAVSVQLAPNALYAGTVVLLAVLVVSVHGLDSPMARAFPTLLALAGLFALVRVTLTVATTHAAGTVLFTTPAVTVPRFFGGFTVGGTVEAEIVARAIAESVVIVATIAVFAAWNAVVSHHEVLQSVPRAFHEPGLVVTVGLAFVPSTITALRTTQESDRARTGGVVVRRGRLLRTTLPVLESGLERAVALAESMDARGFARGLPTRAEHAAGWFGLGALLALGGAFVALVGRAGPAAGALGLLGTALAIAAVAAASRGSRRHRYRPRRLTRVDVGCMLAVTLAPLTLAALALAGSDALTWDAGTLDLPRVDAAALLAFGALAVPAAVRPAGAAR